MLVALLSSFFVFGFATAILSSNEPKKTQFDLRQLFSNAFLLFKTRKVNSLSSEVATEKSSPSDNLLTKAQVEERFETGSWQNLAYEEFKTTLLARDRSAKTFPCIYATKGYRANDHRYVFLDSPDPSQPRNIRILGPAMRAYLAEAHSLGPNTSLVIICAPGDQVGTVEEYNTLFWNLLRGLRIFDSKAWPNDVPQNTSNEHWTFCFNGEPVFPIALTPGHEKRRSRYASNLIIAMQPKWVIDNLMSTPEKREHATETVRGLLKKYDDIEISPDLSNIGEIGTTESRQLTLLDHNEPSECPYEDMDI